MPFDPRKRPTNWQLTLGKSLYENPPQTLPLYHQCVHKNNKEVNNMFYKLKKKVVNTFSSVIITARLITTVSLTA